MSREIHFIAGNPDQKCNIKRLLNIISSVNYNYLMSETQPKESTPRIKEGGIVYFTEPNNALGKRLPDFTLTVRKATVIQAEGRDYPVALIWDDVSRDPKGTGTSVTKSRQELFTTEELQSLIATRKEFQVQDVDDLVKDVKSNTRLGIILSEAVRQRVEDQGKSSQS